VTFPRGTIRLRTDPKTLCKQGQQPVTTSLDDAPLSSFHKRLAAYASGGAFMQGYILSITGVAMVQIAPQLNLSPLQQGLVVGSALVGGLPGAYFGGFLADKFGRQTLYSLVLGLTIVCHCVVLGYELGGVDHRALAHRSGCRS